jgi:hypothetical protein
MSTWTYLVLAILLLLVILFFLSTLILTFVTAIVDAGAKPGIVIFSVIFIPTLVFGDILLIREWRKRIRGES